MRAITKNIAQCNIIFTNLLYFLELLLVRLLTNYKFEAKMAQPSEVDERILVVNNPWKAKLKHPQQYGTTLKVLQNLLT